jgi:hypothetical protein
MMTTPAVVDTLTVDLVKAPETAADGTEQRGRVVRNGWSSQTSVSPSEALLSVTSCA